MFHPGSQVHSSPREPEMDAGRHHRAKLGFILMSTDLAAEAILPIWCPTAWPCTSPG